MKRITSGLAVAAMALAFVGVSSTRADAAFSLAFCSVQYCQSGTSLFVFDNQSGDLNPADGRITAFEGGVGGFGAFDVESALSQPRDGVAGDALLDITYQATGAGDVWLYATDSDFTGTGSATIQNNGNNSGGTVTTAVASLYGGSTNVAGDVGPLIGTLAGLSGSATFPFSPSVNPYELLLEFHLVSSGTTTGDLSASVPVPEPVSMALFGLGLFGTGLASRRRRRA